MFNIGMPELIVVFIVALLLFGPRRLPEISRQIARAVMAFKRAAGDLKDAFEQDTFPEITEEDKKKLGKSAEEKAQSR